MISLQPLLLLGSAPAIQAKPWERGQTDPNSHPFWCNEALCETVLLKREQGDFTCRGTSTWCNKDEGGMVLLNCILPQKDSKISTALINFGLAGIRVSRLACPSLCVYVCKIQTCAQSESKAGQKNTVAYADRFLVRQGRWGRLPPALNLCAKQHS